MSGGGEGVGVESPSCPSRRFLAGGVKPDGEGIETSSSGEFGPVVVEATGESREKEFWVAIPGEATGVEKETFLCFLGIFKRQGKGVEGRCLLCKQVGLPECQTRTARFTSRATFACGSSS